jgi:hypothetical protein
MNDKDLIESIAEILYNYEGGMHPDEYEMITGVKKKMWMTNAPWDQDILELAEHERDEYRLQACQVVKYLRGLGRL